MLTAGRPPSTLLPLPRPSTVLCLCFWGNEQKWNWLKRSFPRTTKTSHRPLAMFECGLARCWTGGNRVIDTGSHCLLLLLLLLRRASLTGRRRCAALKSISLVQLVFPSRATRATRSLFPLRCLSKLVKPKSSGGGCSNVRFHQKCPKLPQAAF